MTQGFFTSLLERRDFEHLRQERGRSRAFLLASLQHFLANDAARRRTQKRGGGVRFVPLALDEAEGRYRIEPAESGTPETLYERRWALTVIDRVLNELRREWEANGRAVEFDELKSCLLGVNPSGGYAAIGRAISLVRVLVAWAPAIAWLLYLASSPRVQGFVPTPPSPMLGALVTLAALGIGAILTIARPERGPHDWLLGTWVVPR